MRVRMKNLMGVMEGGSIPALSNLENALKAEQKVLLFSHKIYHALSQTYYHSKLLIVVASLGSDVLWTFCFGLYQAPPGTARRKRRSASRRQFVDSSSARPGPRGFGSSS